MFQKTNIQKMEVKPKIGARNCNYKILKHKTIQPIRNLALAQMIITTVIILLDIHLVASTSNQDFLHVCNITSLLATAIFGVFATRNATPSIIKQLIGCNVFSFIIMAALATVSLLSLVDCSEIGLVKILLSIEMLLEAAGESCFAFQ